MSIPEQSITEAPSETAPETSLPTHTSTLNSSEVRSLGWWGRFLRALGFKPRHHPNVVEANNADANNYYGTPYHKDNKQRKEKEEPNVNAPSFLVEITNGKPKKLTKKKFSEEVWDDIDRVAEMAGNKPAPDIRERTFRYDVLDGNEIVEEWTFRHSVLKEAHQDNFPAILVIVAGFGLIASIQYVLQLMDDELALLPDALPPMNSCLCGLSTALLCIYFQLGSITTTILASIVVVLAYHLMVGPVPRPLSMFSMGAGNHFDFPSLLATRFALPVISTIVAQFLISCLELVGLAKPISQHRAGSQLLLFLAVSALSSWGYFELINYANRLKSKLGINKGQDKFDVAVHQLLSVLFAFIVVGTACHILNFAQFEIKSGSIFLLDPLVFFVPFGSSPFRAHNIATIAVTGIIAMLVFHSSEFNQPMTLAMSLSITPSDEHPDFLADPSDTAHTIHHENRQQYSLTPPLLSADEVATSAAPSSISQFPMYQLFHRSTAD
eukprot:Gregarina_sp_Poly_1__2380@NODE_1638_length_3652_cov_71_030126_g1080_i0_p1_GENE_NODE_1638_length_3652_cov_71_030126_g1080_i0NODE_1638_length_3652_cov_71_030126_g1080_i0_p1_ORF_typecomplete_len496_score55_96Phage_holin_3_3/PF16083_5/5_7Phage_holin_3_3/PF16083_5/2_9e03Phage_holin_3_3/PF16083_5/1_NODE_1638_length_3652_cov_71_030126_g1080_i04571944